MTVSLFPDPADGTFVCERFACVLAARACLERQTIERSDPGVFPDCNASCFQGSAVAAMSSFYEQHPLAALRLIEDRKKMGEGKGARKGRRRRQAGSGSF